MISVPYITTYKMENEIAINFPNEPPAIKKEAEDEEPKSAPEVANDEVEVKTEVRHQLMEHFKGQCPNFEFDITSIQTSY